MPGQEMCIKIPNIIVWRWRSFLLKRGFSENKGKKYTSFRKKYTDLSKRDESEIKGLRRKFCLKTGISCDIIDENFVRNTSYRKDFFENNKPKYGNKYRCIYCGRLFVKEKITVDHIYPVDAAKYKANQVFLKLFGIKDINCLKNLGAACERCNKRKSAKTGMWVVKGIIGKSDFLWYVRYVLRILLILCLLFVFFYTYLVHKEFFNAAYSTFIK